MDRSLPLFLIGIIFGGGIGFAVAASMGVTFDGHDHGNPAHHGGMSGMAAQDHARMHETPVAIPAAEAPGLEIALHPDPVSGYNLQVLTEGFRFSPRNAGAENLPGEGHAHVYVNGTKVGRLYGEWMHLAELPEGAVEVEVTLNANDHRPLAVDGTPIAARETLEVPAR